MGIPLPGGVTLDLALKRIKQFPNCHLRPFGLVTAIHILSVAFPLWHILVFWNFFFSELLRFNWQNTQNTRRSGLDEYLVRELSAFSNYTPAPEEFQNMTVR